jgi:SOS-response transcriptional repressor LexA
MLTHRQHDAMLAIEAAIERTGGVAPTVEELAASLKLRSRTAAWKLIDGLVLRGFVRRLPGEERGLEVVRPVSRFKFLRFDAETGKAVLAQPP